MEEKVSQSPRQCQEERDRDKINDEVTTRSRPDHDGSRLRRGKNQARSKTDRGIIPGLHLCCAFNCPLARVVERNGRPRITVRVRAAQSRTASPRLCPSLTAALDPGLVRDIKRPRREACWEAEAPCATRNACNFSGIAMVALQDKKRTAQRPRAVVLLKGAVSSGRQLPSLAAPFSTPSAPFVDAGLLRVTMFFGCALSVEQCTGSRGMGQEREVPVDRSPACQGPCAPDQCEAPDVLHPPSKPPQRVCSTELWISAGQKMENNKKEEKWQNSRNQPQQAEAEWRNAPKLATPATATAAVMKSDLSTV